MKNIYLSLLAILVAGGLSAQNLNGRTITIVGDSAEIIETGVVRVNNNSSQNVSLKVKRQEGNLVAGSANYFCWTICYGPSTNVSPSAMTVTGNGYNDNFHGYYDPAMNPGESTISYIFFNTANTNDSVWFTVNYRTSGVGDTLSDPFIDVNFSAAGISENSTKVSSPAYPNPSANHVSFNLVKSEKTDRVEVYNMLGEKVYVQQLTDFSKVIIPVNRLHDGIYFCNFLRNENVIGAERFSVVH